MSEKASLDRFLDQDSEGDDRTDAAADESTPSTPSVTSRFDATGVTCQECRRTVSRVWQGSDDSFRCRECYNWTG